MERVNVKDEHKPLKQENKFLQSPEKDAAFQDFASRSGKEAGGNELCRKKLVFLPTYERRMKDELNEWGDPADQRNDRAAQYDGLMRKKKRVSIKESAGMPVMDRQEYNASLDAKVRQLKKETRGLNSELRQLARSCMQISEENKFLLDELRQICEPSVIAMLEAMNPDKNPQY